ncbi:transcriptional regulatory protein, partial [Clarias magur]
MWGCGGGRWAAELRVISEQNGEQTRAAYAEGATHFLSLIIIITAYLLLPRTSHDGLPPVVQMRLCAFCGFRQKRSH